MRKISSFALALGFVMPLAGCPAGDDTETSETNATTATATATATATDTDPDPTATATDTATDTDPDPDTGSGSDTAGDGGFCAQTCETPEDCAGEFGNAADWECDGFCEFIGTPPACDPAMCDDLMIGTCAEVDGTSLCVQPCPMGDECVAPTECIGSTDAGDDYCTTPPPEPCGGVEEGEPCEFEALGGALGTCTDGVCSCASSEECTVDGFDCNL